MSAGAASGLTSRPSRTTVGMGSPRSRKAASRRSSQTPPPGRPSNGQVGRLGTRQDRSAARRCSCSGSPSAERRSIIMLRPRRSPRSSSDGEIVRPSALALLMLITRSNCVACSTGRSVGFVEPLDGHRPVATSTKACDPSAMNNFHRLAASGAPSLPMTRQFRQAYHRSLSPWSSICSGEADDREFGRHHGEVFAGSTGGITSKFACALAMIRYRSTSVSRRCHVYAPGSIPARGRLSRGAKELRPR